MSDLFGGFDSLIKGFSGFLPQDDPDVKIIAVKSELNDLQKQEIELYAEVGRRVLLMKAGQFPELESKLQLVQANIMEVKRKLGSAQTEKEAKDSAKQAEEEARTCPSCGNVNPDGVKFCQECGAKLGTLKCFKCGATLSPGTRFCGECGAKQEG